VSAAGHQIREADRVHTTEVRGLDLLRDDQGLRIELKPALRIAAPPVVSRWPL
jgi:hypothetical protein